MEKRGVIKRQKCKWTRHIIRRKDGYGRLIDAEWVANIRKRLMCKTKPLLSWKYYENFFVLQYISNGRWSLWWDIQEWVVKISRSSAFQKSVKMTKHQILEKGFFIGPIDFERLYAYIYRVVNIYIYI